MLFACLFLHSPNFSSPFIYTLAFLSIYVCIRLRRMKLVLLMIDVSWRLSEIVPCVSVKCWKCTRQMSHVRWHSCSVSFRVSAQW